MNGHQKQREQSGRMIEDALFALMKEKNFSQITVSEIVKKADVARRTFYRLYKGKEEILHCYFNKLCQDYCSKHDALRSYDIRRIAGEYFGFWYQYRKLLLLMYSCGMEEMLYYEISRVSVEVVKSRMNSRAEKSDREIAYFADYSTGGFILLLHRWIRNGMTETPEEYAELVSASLLKFLS